MSVLKWIIAICVVAMMSIAAYHVTAVDCNDAKRAFYKVRKSLYYERNIVEYFEAMEGELHGASKTLVASAEKRQYNITRDLLKANEVVDALCDQPGAD